VKIAMCDGRSVNTIKTLVVQSGLMEGMMRLDIGHKYYHLHELAG